MSVNFVKSLYFLVNFRCTSFNITFAGTLFSIRSLWKQKKILKNTHLKKKRWLIPPLTHPQRRVKDGWDGWLGQGIKSVLQFFLIIESI